MLRKANEDVRLSGEELSRIEAHLREQYCGVFDEKMIAAHLSEFVESGLADNLAAVIAKSSEGSAKLLDIGSGYGAFVLSCRQHGLDATGFELADFEVEISKQRLSRCEPDAHSDTVFQNGDGGRLPFPDGSFEIVTLLNVLEHVPDYGSVLSEAVRVLRPGGRLIFICPNYAALRREAHYHVIWPPLLPRRLASRYLRILGRNPEFFERHIYYCTNWGILRVLNRLGMRASNLDLLRIDHPELIKSGRARQIVEKLHAARLLPLLKLVLKAGFYNPFKASVMVVATKAIRS